MPSDYTLQLKQLWFSGGEWKSGFAQAVCKQEYLEAHARLMRQDRDSREPFVDDPTVYDEAVRNLEHLQKSYVIYKSLSRLDRGFIAQMHTLFTNQSKLLKWQARKLQSLCNQYAQTLPSATQNALRISNKNQPDLSQAYERQYYDRTQAI